LEALFDNAPWSWLLGQGFIYLKHSIDERFKTENKVPNFPWKKQQTERLSIDGLLKNWNYKGGIQRKDGTEIPSTTNFGIITGFEDLECIDIDLKVLSTAKEQRDFWDEFMYILNENILDFNEKVAIYKTKNSGYHILYKSKRVEGNLKLALLKVIRRQSLKPEVLVVMYFLILKIEFPISLILILTIYQIRQGFNYFNVQNVQLY
jgi:hypothetical protein